MHPSSQDDTYLAENKRLREQVAKLEATLEALASGSADALILPSDQNVPQIFVREGSDLPYLAVLEAMNEGALTLSLAGDILYCNPRFADFVGRPATSIRGKGLNDFIAPGDMQAFLQFLETGRDAPCRNTFRLCSPKTEHFPAQFSAQPLHVGPLHVICIVVTDMRAVEAAALALQASERRWRELSEQWSGTFDAVKDPIFLHDQEMRLVRANKAYFDVAGIPPEEAIGRCFWEVFPKNPDASPCNQDLDTRADDSLSEEIAQGERLYRCRRFPVFDDEGEFLFGIHILEDITARRQAEYQLHLSASVFDQAGEGIIITDPEGRIVAVNSAFSRITGYAADDAIGRTPGILKSGLHTRSFYQDMWVSLHGKGNWQGEIHNRRKDGTTFPEWLTITEVRNSKGNLLNYVGIFSDITTIKNSQIRIEFLATHDELTGLPNRNLFLDRVRHAINRATREPGHFSLLFIDIDNFKIVNDSLGHAAGDLLLQQMAERLKAAIREADTVARFGGDEFALLIENATVDDAGLAAYRIVQSLAVPFTLERQVVHCSVSIGITLFPDDADDAESLLKHADTAMYEAKQRGKGCYEFFSNEIRLAAEERLRIESKLHDAIELNELFLCYQPQVSLETGFLIGVEALIRWQHPELGLVPPDRFIPIAEKSRLIDRIGEWVAESACRQMALWRSAGFNVPRVSINVSAEQFRRSDIPGMFERLLREYQLEPSQVMVELTESALVKEPSKVQEILARLKALGLQLSIDDFGTGYSSLSYLRRYPINELKIDRSFVENLADNVGNQTLVKTIIAMADVLKMSVVAEGIENEEQAKTLHLLGCSEGQGFHFARPLLPSQLVEHWRQ